MNTDEISKATSDFDAKSETLDYLYKEQLKELREMILKNMEFNDIEICRKWLKIFNKINPTEKLARNCLCTLMQEQIKEKGCLTEPFTNVHNMQKNLESILKELDEIYSVSTNIDAGNNYSNESDRTSVQIKSDVLLEECNADRPNKNQMNVEGNQLQCQLDHQKQREDEQENQLHILRLQLTEKSIENVKLKEIAEKYYYEKEHKNDIFNIMKQNILDGIHVKLLTMEKSGMRSQSYIFTDIFTNYSHDVQFMDNLKKYDIEFQHILEDYFRKEFEKRKTFITRHISRQYKKSKSKLREKYESKLKLQEKLIKLSCFSTLRQICIECYQKFDKMDMCNILHNLEQKYQSILNTIHNGTHLGM